MSRLITTHAGTKNGYDALADRFWAKVACMTMSRCWHWQATKDAWGYGQFKVGRVMRGAHRVSWELANGRSAGALSVLHRCDTPSCVNPSHLFLGTSADNVADMMSKGRGRTAVGEDHRCASFTEAQVVEIRARHAAGASIRGLAREYGVRDSGMWMLVHRRTWKSVG